MKGSDLNDRGIVYLVEAIGVLAVKDYRVARKMMSRKGWEKQAATTPTGGWQYEIRTSPMKMLTEVERFFLGGWFEMLSGIDGKMMLDRISRECDLKLRRCGEQKEKRKHKTHAPGSGRIPSTSWEELRPLDPELARLLEAMRITRATLAAEMGVEYKTLCSMLRRKMSDQTLRRIKEAAASIISRRMI